MPAYSHDLTEVGTEPTLICTVPPGASSVMLQNVGDVPVFLGGPDVAVDGPRLGMALAAGAETSLPSPDPVGSDLYGVTADGSTVIVYLY